VIYLYLLFEFLNEALTTAILHMWKTMAAFCIMLDKKEIDLKAKAPWLVSFFGEEMTWPHSTQPHTHYRYRPVCEHTQNP